MSTIEKARALIEWYMGQDKEVPQCSWEASAEIMLASKMSVICQLRVELAQSEVYRYRAEYSLAQLQLERAQESLRKAQAESRGEA